LDQQCSQPQESVHAMDEECQEMEVESLESQASNYIVNSKNCHEKHKDVYDGGVLLFC